MTSFDIFVSVVLGFSLIFSLMKGFVREIFSLISYVGGYLMAVKYQNTFAQVLMESIPSKPLAKLIAFGAIYIVTAIIISLMGKVAKAMLWSGTDLSTFDRIMGGVVGLARGVVIIVAVTFPLQFFPELAEKFTKDSYSAPYLAKVLDFVNQNPGTLNIRQKISNFDMEGAKEKFNDLKDLKNLSDKISDLKKNLPNNSQPQDEYTKDDLEKLNDIFKSVDSK
ncbi:MAG: CvpA family protein [Nitrospina sp.]|mgnify:FL=1|jgi:membrane protein required for colicin V production|nr:CvpA family protein [Nitrospina sp.]MBT3875863.1 CvpA family protein [Nitrospina sp.]MBT4049310.1 CvpA family protein [Nitrospina sp.]MBT4557278.1 CvpA family protein [Nitrospina sp.]MBT5347550.1 CvpA family protein [Nitrospina sp.]